MAFSSGRLRSKKLIEFDGRYDDYFFSTDGTKIFYIHGWDNLDLQFADLSTGGGFRQVGLIQSVNYKISWLNDDSKALFLPPLGSLANPPYNTEPAFILSIGDFPGLLFQFLNINL